MLIWKWLIKLVVEVFLFFIKIIGVLDVVRVNKICLGKFSWESWGWLFCLFMVLVGIIIKGYFFSFFINLFLGKSFWG